jgi:hypothetical protein
MIYHFSSTSRESCTSEAEHFVLPDIIAYTSRWHSFALLDIIAYTTHSYSFILPSRQFYYFSSTSRESCTFGN